ncbi:hypothetical protein BDQ17DRAFT_1428709 [Cyathus striatus]|nr:hypothetical protein BDQ17DRAFT_1428709 [Cyathus striatus]
MDSSWSPGGLQLESTQNSWTIWTILGVRPDSPWIPWSPPGVQPEWGVECKDLEFQNVPPPTYLMPGFLHLLRCIFIFIIPYNDVKSTTQSPTQVESLIKKFSAQRALCLMIDKHSSRKFQLDHINPGAILFTRRISLAYNGLNKEQFKMQIRIIGPEIYTIINMLPAIILQLMLLYEIFMMSSSITLAVIIAFSCFTLGFALFVAVSLMGNMESELMPLTDVTTNMARHAAV